MFLWGEILIVLVLNSCCNKIILSVLSQPLYVYARTMELCPQFLFHQGYTQSRTNFSGPSLLGLVLFNIFINDPKGVESRLIKFKGTTC